MTGWMDEIRILKQAELESRGRRKDRRQKREEEEEEEEEVEFKRTDIDVLSSRGE